MAGPYNRFPGYDASYQIDPAALTLVQIDNPTTLPAPVQAHASGAYTLTLDPTQLVWCEAATTLALPTPTASWTYRIVVQIVTGGNAVTLPTVPWRGGVVPKLADANPWLIQRLQFDWGGSAWTGSWTALDVDYPIDAIAGTPVALLTTPGWSADMSSSFTAHQGRTFYASWNLLTVTPPAAAVRVAYTGVSLPSALFIQRQAAATSMQAFVGTDDVSSGVIAIGTAANKTGLNAFVSVMNDGMSLWEWAFASGESGSAPLATPNAGINQVPFQLNLQPATATLTPLIAAAYPAVHDAYQQTAIMQKLTRMAA